MKFNIQKKKKGIVMRVLEFLSEDAVLGINLIAALRKYIQNVPKSCKNESLFLGYGFRIDTKI